jgi:type IV pilus assembly protein PilM
MDDSIRNDLPAESGDATPVDGAMLPSVPVSAPAAVPIAPTPAEPEAAPLPPVSAPEAAPQPPVEEPEPEPVPRVTEPEPVTEELASYVPPVSVAAAAPPAPAVEARPVEEPEPVTEEPPSYVPPVSVAAAAPPVPAVEARPVEEPEPVTEELPSSVPPVSVAASAPPVPAVEARPVEEPPPAAPQVPFWKRDLSFSRKPKQQAAAAGPKTPFWKKELSFSRKKRTDADFDTPDAQSASKAKQAKGKQTIVGLKIGASQIAAARIQNGATPHLVQLVREPLSDGVVVAGELRDVEALAATLKRLFSKHKLPKKGVRLGIANNRIGVRTFDIAGIEDPDQLANAIKFRAQETLPIPLDEAVLDWQVLSETTDPTSGQVTRRVLLVVAYRELVDRYAAACAKAGIRLSGIDLEAFAMLRALTPPAAPGAPPADGAQVVVNVGHDRSTFAVSDGRACEFTRVLGWGGSALSVAIARAFDVTPSEAEPVKQALSLVEGAEAPEGMTPEAHEQARESLRRELQAFARELVSSLRFYQNQPGSLGIGGLVLTGGTAHLPGLPAELERLIGVPVTVGDPLARVTLPKKFELPDRVGSLAVAIGLGIED